jgi:predicted phosphodiesterase
MKLFAVSDLHLSHAANRRAFARISPRPEDWLILAGDVAEKYSDLEFAFETVVPRFKQVVWVPGNHELWTLPSSQESERGQFRYERLVALCRSYGILTPEDPYPVVAFATGATRIVPLFLLYDYSFRPDHVPIERAVEWARESGIVCTDELLLYPDPFPGRAEWCHARCDLTETRLKRCQDGVPAIFINHFPMRGDLVHIPRIPRFSIWCGTRRTEDWHVRFNASVVVSGHLHVRSLRYRDGVRFEEVSFGYPRQHPDVDTIDGFVREIWPGPAAAGGVQSPQSPADDHHAAARRTRVAEPERQVHRTNTASGSKPNTFS